MATEMFSCEFDRYDKKQHHYNLYTLVGVLMALLESIGYPYDSERLQI